MLIKQMTVNTFSYVCHVITHLDYKLNIIKFVVFKVVFLWAKDKGFAWLQWLTFSYYKSFNKLKRDQNSCCA